MSRSRLHSFCFCLFSPKCLSEHDSTKFTRFCHHCHCLPQLNLSSLSVQHVIFVSLKPCQCWTEVVNRSCGLMHLPPFISHAFTPNPNIRHVFAIMTFVDAGVNTTDRHSMENQWAVTWGHQAVVHTNILFIFSFCRWLLNLLMAHIILKLQLLKYNAARVKLRCHQSKYWCWNFLLCIRSNPNEAALPQT